MPTYTYQCKKCGHSFDLFHGISATPRVKCPECDAACRRLIGKGAGIIFKGSGFYQTDYKNKSGITDHASGNSDTKKGEPKSETKSEFKAEKKESAPASPTTKAKE